MLRLLARRARAQWSLLASLLVVLTVGATLLGTCALLVTRTSEKAYETTAARADPEQVAVTAYTVTIGAGNVRSVVADTHALLDRTIAPFTGPSTMRAASMMRALPGVTNAEAYLAGIEDLKSRARLVSGTWPEASPNLGTPANPKAPVQAVILSSTAGLLHLRVGSRVRLGTEKNRDPAGPLDVTVVGIVDPLPGTGWDRDVLGGTGYDPDYTDGYRAFGPFLIDLDDLYASGSNLDRLEVTVVPGLARNTPAQLDSLADAVAGADRRLAAALGDRVEIERVSSQIPQTLALSRQQQQATASTVFAVGLIGVLLTAIALALAARLTAEIRIGETGLLSALGTGRGQFAVVAAGEAVLVALASAVLAIPASSVLHAAITHLPPLSGAGLAAGPEITVVQVATVLIGALALAVTLIVLAVVPASRYRAGVDLAVVALAAIGWWQLRTQPGDASPRTDLIRVTAPALLLVAGVLLALRLVPPALRLADRFAGRSDGLALPLAVYEAARRPRAIAAGLLVCLGCAAGTFGTAFASTWQASQHDQADLSVGTDLALSLVSAPVTGQSARVRAATGGTISPVATRGVAVGQWLGAAGDPPRLVALDTSKAGDLLRGRGADWAAIGGKLAPATRPQGMALPANTAPALTMTGPAGVTAIPKMQFQDAYGLRTWCQGDEAGFDGRPHALTGCVPADGERLVAVSIVVPASMSTGGRVTITLPGAADGWTAKGAANQFTGTSVGVENGRLTVHTVLRPGDPDGHDAVLTVAAFPDPIAVPVAVSERFAAGVHATVGTKLSVTFGTTPVPVVVAAIVPQVPSAPGAAAVLADIDTLSRALTVAGDLDFPVDDWWVGHPRADAADRAAALKIGTTTTRTGEAERLTRGPLRAELPAVLRLLVPAALVLLLTGLVLHVTSDLRARAVEVARLRGLGMTRREIRTVLLGQHGGVLLPLIVAGAVVGGLATAVVAPLLIRSDTGAVPIPSPVTSWPWAAESLLLLGLTVACGVAVTIVVVVQTRRADAAHLRVTS